MKALRALGAMVLNLLALAAFLAAAAFLVLAIVQPAYAAGTVGHVTWVNPTEYTDGSPLAASELKETVIEWRRTAAGPLVGSVRVPAPASSADVPGLACGDFVFVGYSVTRSTATYPNAQGPASAPPVVYATGIACTPKAISLGVS